MYMILRDYKTETILQTVDQRCHGESNEKGEDMNVY